ncbi:hypothetical protein MMC19_003556 [Ptychographa xylographoides]|nr:hypothetical protein [Ptychographa xylographoides]
MADVFDTNLAERLAQDLPKDLRFTVHHLCSLPVACPPIFVPAPGQLAEDTTCESHFLSISVKFEDKTIQVFALEVLIYITDTLTTLFVSKADSTGYLYLLNLPKGTPSPLKIVLRVFLGLLVESKKKQGVRLVLSLFARSQVQYLFPGSVENKHKHILDDRELIKWWCQILDQVIQPSTSPKTLDDIQHNQSSETDTFTSRCYVRVPGCDQYETRAFLPDYVRRSGFKTSCWLVDDPLQRLGKPRTTPERCLIPRFPDDPKARFVIDLDDELPDVTTWSEDRSSKQYSSGKWRSVKCLAEFWDMMSFRQECAAGRLVGFLWGVLTPTGLIDRDFCARAEDQDSLATSGKGKPSLLDATGAQTQARQESPSISPNESGTTLEVSVSDLTASQVSQLDTSLAEAAPLPTMVDAIENHRPPTAEQLVEKFHKHFPGIVLRESAYAHVMSLLQQLDYATLPLASDSTRRWVLAAATESGVDNWGMEVVGRRDLQPSIPITVVNGMTEDQPAMLNFKLLRKKKRSGTDVGEVEVSNEKVEAVMVLGAGLVRKKPRVESFDAEK